MQSILALDDIVYLMLLKIYSDYPLVKIQVDNKPRINLSLLLRPDTVLLFVYSKNYVMSYHHLELFQPFLYVVINLPDMLHNPALSHHPTIFLHLIFLLLLLVYFPGFCFLVNLLRRNEKWKIRNLYILLMSLLTPKISFQKYGILFPRKVFAVYQMIRAIMNRYFQLLPYCYNSIDKHRL